MNSRAELIDILMRRDGLDPQEAAELIDECREACIEEQSDEPIEDILGLEPDYIFSVLWG